MKLAGRWFGILASGVMLMSAGAPAAAATPKAAANLDTIEATLRSMEESGVPAAAIDATMSSRFGWTRQPLTQTMSQAAIAPTASHVNIYQPTVWKDTTTGFWVARATWAWKDCAPQFDIVHCWFTDDGCYVVGNCGGADGFGINISRAVTRKATKFYTYTEEPYYEDSTYVNPETFNNTGVSFTEQDVVNRYGAHYTWDKGSIYYYFTLPTCSKLKGKTWIIDSKMSHTWSSSSVTGFGVFATGFSISWSNDSGHWSAVNPNPLTWYACGK
jgi:hypothetical protein